jgi:hypothetical protein
MMNKWVAVLFWVNKNKITTRISSVKKNKRRTECVFYREKKKITTDHVRKQEEKQKND